MIDRYVFDREVECFGYEYGLGDDEANIPLSEAITKLTAALNSIPEHLRSTAVLNLRAYGDYANVYADVKYQEPETDEQVAARHAKERADKLNKLAADEARERTLYENLRRKFEAAAQAQGERK